MDEAFERVNLGAKRDAMAGSLSRGMTQRLVLAKTLLHDPEVLLLDEPASGLDPIARIDLRNLLRGLAERGKTVLISSHILNELSEFCTSIGIMEKGVLKLSGAIEDIVADLNTTRRYTVETIGPADAAAALIGAREGLEIVETLNGRCDFESTLSDEESASLLAELVGGGIAVVAFYERRRGVEDVVLHVDATETS